MGIDARVYRNRSALSLGEDLARLRIVAETGEVYFDDQELSCKYPNDDFTGSEFRLGNASEVAELRAEIAAILGASNFIEEKILYSGSHSGDWIPTSDLPALAKEVEFLSGISLPKSTNLVEFLEKLKSLLYAAESNQNPIVFV